MKPLAIVLSAAAGFATARYWPQTASQDPATTPPGLASQVTSGIGPAVEDRALLEFARSLATADASGLGALYASLPGRFGPGRFQLAQRLVLLRWAETMPHDALAWLKANAPRDLPMFFIAWSESDAAAAWRAASAAGAEARQGLLAALSDRLDRAPAETVIAIIDALPDEAMAEGSLVIARDAESLYAAAFHKLATANPGEALDRALALTGVRRAAALGGVAAARAEKDAAGALDWARSLTEKADRNAALGPVIVDLSRRDPESAGALLKEMDNPFEQSASGYGPGTIVLRRMSEENATLAYQWAERYAPGSDLHHLAGQVITQTAARTHPRGLPAILASIGNTEVRSQAIRTLDSYAGPEALPDLAAGASVLPAGADRDDILRNIFRAWADHSPDEALERARALPAGPVRDAALAGATEKLISRSPDSPGTIEAINSLPDTVRPQLHEEWLRALAYTSPDRAAALLGDVTDPDDHERIAKGIAEGWMQIDTPAALAFVATLEGSERRDAFHRVFDRWSAADPAAVTGWIAAQPPGDDRDAAIGSLIGEGGRHGENEAAFRWSLETTSAAKRERAITLSARNLVSQDRELAVRVIAEANLTEAERTMVEALLATPPASAK